MARRQSIVKEMRTPIAASACALVLVFLAGGVWAAASTTSTSVAATPSTTTVVSVYSDGSAGVNQTFTIQQNTTSLSIPLFSSQVGDILAVDQSGIPVSYQISGQNITLYTLGDTRVSLVYDTEGLTTKQGAVWTVSFDSPFNVTLILPYQSTIISVPSAPVQVFTEDGSPALTLSPGSWQISYGLALTTVTSSSSIASSASSTNSISETTASSATGGSTSSSNPASSSSASTSSSSTSARGGGASLPYVGYLAVAAVVAASLAAVGAAVARRRRSGVRDDDSKGLRHDDMEMLRFIKDSGGDVLESAVRDHFSLPRTSAWRQAKRLERMGYVRITKEGGQNRVRLLKPDFEPTA